MPSSVYAGNFTLCFFANSISVERRNEPPRCTCRSVFGMRLMNSVEIAWLISTVPFRGEWSPQSRHFDQNIKPNGETDYRPIRRDLPGVLTVEVQTWPEETV